MLLNELVGDITPNPEHLVSFVNAWYKDTDYISLVAIPSQEFKTHNKRNKVLSQAVLVSELKDVTSKDMEGLVMGPGIQYNMYLGINPLNKDNKVSLHARGDETEIREIYGVFIDFDIKDGCFSNKQDILAFLDKFAVTAAEPSIVIDNGKHGGIHAYWRFHLSDDELVIGDQARALLQNWWSLVAEHASLWEEGVAIDRLIDLTRVSRMPGGIYWPSKDLGSTEVPLPDLVRVIHLGPRYTVQQITELCSGAGERYREKIKAIRQRENERIVNSDEAIRNILNKKVGERIGNHWGALAAIAYIEDIFSATWSWEQILEPAGWTFLYKDHEGRKIVARPGRHEKSATVDWAESPNMMSLLSTSPDTGLSDLKEIGVPLNKWRVAQRLLWNDDEEAMVDDVMKSVYKE